MLVSAICGISNGFGFSPDLDKERAFSSKKRDGFIGGYNVHPSILIFLNLS